MAFSFLILENESAFVNKLKNIIASMNSESKVYSTWDVNEALEKTEQVNIDVFVVDINLGDSLAGLDFIKEVRKMHKLTPIIVVGSNVDMQDKIAAFNELKVYAYIDKPFENEQVVAELKNALEMSELINNRTVSFKRKNYIKVYHTKDIYCIQRVPHGKKQILVTSYDDTVNEVTTEAFSIKSSLGEILDLFENDKDIIRVHQSWLINPKMIRGLHLAKEELTLISNIKIPVGETYKHNFFPFI
jgi:DNA-binding LytR/AlgR family response regulator